MKIETALKNPRTVQQLVKLTGLSRGGVLSSLKRLKCKKAGKTDGGARGPQATMYILRGVARKAPGKVHAPYAPYIETPQTGVQAEPAALPETPLEKALDANEAPTEALYQAPVVEGA